MDLILDIQKELQDNIIKNWSLNKDTCTFNKQTQNRPKEQNNTTSARLIQNNTVSGTFPKSTTSQRFAPARDWPWPRDLTHRYVPKGWNIDRDGGLLSRFIN